MSETNRGWPEAPTGTSLELPAPVSVRLDPATTTLLVMDITDPLCTKRADCMASVPRIASLLGRARRAGAGVVHTIGPKTPTRILDEVAPLDGEPVIAGRADKFYGTHLAETLQERDTDSVIMVGTAANGAVMYTAFGANLRDYTVVVAGDAVSSGNEETNWFVLWQLVNQPGYWNRENEPLSSARVTLATCDRIEFPVS